MTKASLKLFALAATCTLVGTASMGQTQGEVKFSIEWNDNGNGNKVLEPGEIAIGKVYASFTPKGTPAKHIFNGKEYDVVIEGWSVSVKLGVYTTLNGQTGTSMPFTNPLLDEITPWTTNGYDWWELGFYQQQPLFNPNYLYDNPIWMFSLHWTTKDYTPRYVEYYLEGSGPLHQLHASTPLLPAWVSINALGIDSAPSGFWVAPSPGVLSALSLGLVALSGRRR